METLRDHILVILIVLAVAAAGVISIRGAAQETERLERALETMCVAVADLRDEVNQRVATQAVLKNSLETFLLSAAQAWERSDDPIGPEVARVYRTQARAVRATGYKLIPDSRCEG